MAKIEFEQFISENKKKATETIEVIVWSTGGAPSQEFVIGSGGNFDASSNFWIDIRYAVNAIPLFYTRNIIVEYEAGTPGSLSQSLDNFLDDKQQAFGFGDMLPQTNISLQRKKFDSTNDNSEPVVYISYTLTISADMGAIFGHSPPGERMLDIHLDNIDIEQGEKFMRDLIHELEHASQGLHPDPGKLLPGQSEWPFIKELHRQAYDQISVGYQEKYFFNPLLKTAFDTWLRQLPEAGRVLDAGCGHGDPVIGRLLENGFKVTGTDVSPVMLARAKSHYPNAEFRHGSITEIETLSEFDAVCSFSYMLYLDPIDLLHSVHRLQRALKPGGQLFLYGYNLHPSWRGQPFEEDLGQWLWTETHSIHETTQALEEHGYFKVLKSEVVTGKTERRSIIRRWRASNLRNYKEMKKNMPPEYDLPEPDLSIPPANLAYAYIIVAQKLGK